MKAYQYIIAASLSLSLSTALAQQTNVAQQTSKTPATATPQEKAEAATEKAPEAGAIKVENKEIPLNGATNTPEKASTEAPPAAPAKAEENKSSWYFGPNLAFGIPHFNTYGLDAVIPNGYVSFGFNTGSFEGKNADIKIGLKTQEVVLRIHPFSGSFYLGAALGNQTLYAQQTQTISSIPVTLKIDIKSSYTIPHIGWMWGIKDGGFFFSTEFGMQSPSGVKTTLSTDADALVKATQDYQDLEKEVTDAGDKIGKVGLPFITLVKMGWLF